MKNNRLVAKALVVGMVVLLVAAGCAPAVPPAAPAPAPAPAPAAAPAPAVAPAPAPAAPAAAPAPTSVPPRPAPAAALPRRGGSINLPIPALLRGTDPHTTQVLAKETWVQASSTLLTLDSQAYKLQPNLVESWSVSEDGRTVTLNLRKGVKWQNLPPVNGREFTADDVVYNLKRIRGDFPVKGKVFYRAADLRAMADAVAADKHTVKMSLKGATVALVSSMSSNYNTVVPKELVDKCGGTLDDTKNCTVGTGPFILKTFEDGALAAWDRNPDYFKKDEHGQPLPYLDQVKWTWFGDVATIVAALAVGKAAMYQRVGDVEVKALKATQSKVRLKLYDKAVVWGAFLNMTKPPFKDVRLRTVIDLVMERRKSLDNVQGDIPWTWTAFLPRVSGDFALPEEEVQKRPGFRDDKTEDVKAARKLLEEAGYGPNNLLRLKIYASATSTCGRECPILFSDQINTHLKGLAEATPAPITSAERANRLAEADYDFMFFGWSASPDPSDLMISWLHSKGLRNSSRYSSPQMDRLLEEQDRTFDREKRRQLLWQAQRLALDDRPVLVWGNTWAIMVMQPNLFGWTPGSDEAGGDIFYNLDKVWLGDTPSSDRWPIVDK